MPTTSRVLREVHHEHRAELDGAGLLQQRAGIRAGTRQTTGQDGRELHSSESESALDGERSALAVERLSELCAQANRAIATGLDGLPRGTAVRRVVTKWSHNAREVDDGAGPRAWAGEWLQATVRLAADGVVGRGTAARRAWTPDALAEVVAEATRAAGHDLRHRSQATTPAIGRFAVVFGPGAIGTLLHETCGHALEGDSLARRPALLAGGDGGIPTHLTVVDDPTVPGAWGSYEFDDEGAPAFRNTLAAHGTLGPGLHSTATASAAGAPRHCSARSEAYWHGPLPRMSNTFLLPGTTPAAEIIAATDTGLYCEHIAGGSVEPTTGEFNLRMERLHVIRRGALAEPVADGVLVGSAAEVLPAIDLVGDDLELRPGRCGKDGQQVAVAQGGPTTRVREVEVRPL